MGDNGNGDKTVPEKDLLAVKATLTRLKDQYKAEKAELEKGKDTEYQARLGVESSLKKAQKELTEAQASIGELDKVKAERDTATKSRDELSKSVIDLTRKGILESFELTEEVQTKLKGMETLEELQSYSQVLADVGKTRDPAKAGVDAGGGGATVDTTGRSGRDMIKEGLKSKE